ncbi:hypothetical protein SNOUR_36375 [Streptomyces noursei ATCC 11455]|nr:hypothetical protein SNOUR_36375 [Streptomyces noursei ATCC 11455]
MWGGVLLLVPCHPGQATYVEPAPGHTKGRML